MDSGGYDERTFNPKEKSVDGNTHSLYFIFFLLERPLTAIPLLCLIPATIWKTVVATTMPMTTFLAVSLATPVVVILTFCVCMVILSRMEQPSQQHPEHKWEDHLECKDKKFKDT